MHELSLCRAIIDIVNDHVVGQNGCRIKKISLEIGQLAGVDESALRFAFEAITKGTMAEHAILEMIEIEGQAICDTCQKTVKLKHYYDGCQSCGHFSLKVIQGDELRVKCMEIE